MQEYEILGPDDYRSMPWRNGLGSTVELCRQDLPEDGGFAWRLSMADVIADGEFSDFSGYQRSLLLLRGNGITLHYGDGRRDVLRDVLQLARFDGGEPTRASLHDGPIRDFNVMARIGRCLAEVEAAADGRERPIAVDGDVLLVYAPEPGLSLDFDRLATIDIPGSGLLYMRQPPKRSLRCRGAPFIATQIRFAPR